MNHTRHETIIKELDNKGFLSVEEVKGITHTSLPTVYRDLRHLINAGLAKRVTGGIKRLQKGKETNQNTICEICHMPAWEQTKVIFQINGEQQLTACCPHCGLMMLDHHPNISSALVSDFLYGKMVNIRQAIYLFESRVSRCCSPSVLAFACETDARDFQLGFGGDLLNFDQIRSRVKASMSL